ncbi:unnamed protein product, partial [Phaeothamnion confervicola]
MRSGVFHFFLSAAVILCFAPLVDAFVIGVRTTSSHSSWAATRCTAGSKEEEVVTEAPRRAATSPESRALEALWRQAGRPLLRIGKNGVQESHVRSLGALLGDHGGVVR